MHRHGYKGRKFGRERDQRRALMRGLICALIFNLEITTTLARAKEMRRHTEKLITLAKRGGLANRRLLIARLDNRDAANRLMDVIAPQIQRDSGYLRIERAGFRKGDNAELGTISFVDTIELPEKAAAEAEVAAASAKPATKKGGK